MLSRMIAVSLGIAVVSLFPQLPSFIGLLLLVISCGVCVFYRGYFLLPFLVLCGVFWGVVYGYGVIGSQLTEIYEGQPLSVEGAIVNLPETYSSYGEQVQRFDLAVAGAVCKQPPAGGCVDGIKRLRLKWYGQTVLEPGQRWRLTVVLKRPHGMANPAGFDYQTWLIQQGIGAVGTVQKKANNQRLDDRYWSLDRWRWGLSRYIDSLCKHTSISVEPPTHRHIEAGSCELHNGSLLKALLIGDKRAISREQWDLFAATGTTHLMVISGLHVGLVAGWVFVIIGLLVNIVRPHLHAERWAALAAVGAATAYALMAGFSLPTQRALVMVTVYMAAIWAHRNIAALQGLVVALLICLLIDPLSPVSLSFWLSFAAVTCIIFGAVGRRDYAQQRRRWFKSQYLVFIGLLPFLAMLIGRVSLLSPVVNVVMVPLFSVLIVPFNLIAILVAGVSEGLALIIWQLLDQVLDYSLTALDFIQRHGGWALMAVPAQALWINLIGLIGIVLLLLPKGWPLRWMGLVLLLPLLSVPAPLKQGDISVTALDVGQGLSLVVQTRDHVLVYDVGPTLGEDFDTVTAVLMPYLRSQAINRIDRLVISHADNDHAGAWYKLVKQMQVGRLFGGESLIAPQGYHPALALEPCAAADSWSWNGVDFQFIRSELVVSSGQKARGWQGNNASCILRISSADVHFLLPGDIEREAELALVNQGFDLLPATVLFAPHHGSATSSTWPFIKAVDPAYVVFNHGYRNRFAHPRVDVVQRYRQWGSNLFSSAESGALEFRVVDGQLQVPQSYRAGYQRYWLLPKRVIN